MSFTYDVDQLSSSAMMRLRLELGDTDSDRALLQDEEIRQIIDEESNFHLRVIACCRLILAKIAKNPESYQVEGYSESNRNMVNHYKDLIHMHSARGGGTPWVGSIETSFKDDTADDTTLVKPLFKRGMHDYQ